MTIAARLAAVAAVLARAAADALDALARSLVAQQETAPDVLPAWVDDGSATW